MKKRTLATVSNSFQASILQNALTNEGIIHSTKNEVISSVLPAPGFQIEIEVYEKDYEMAKEILKEAFPEMAKE